jgi:DNA-binding transcriptional MerR regulator
MTLAHLPNKQTALLPVQEIIRLAKEAGFDFGFGDPYNRLRYYIKIGLLPNIIRRSVNGGATQGHMPTDTVEKLLFIQCEKEKGSDYPEIALKLSGKNVLNNNSDSEEKKETASNDNKIEEIFHDAGQNESRELISKANVFERNFLPKELLNNAQKSRAAVFALGTLIFFTSLLLIWGGISNKISFSRGNVKSEQSVLQATLSDNDAVSDNNQKGEVLASEFTGDNLTVDFNIPAQFGSTVRIATIGAGIVQSDEFGYLRSGPIDLAREMRRRGL